MFASREEDAARQRERDEERDERDDDAVVADHRDRSTPDGARAPPTAHRLGALRRRLPSRRLRSSPAAVMPNAACSTASSFIVCLVELGDDPPAAHDEHAVGEPEHLLELGRDQQHGDPLGRERLDQLVDRALRADVDAARRLVGDEDARRAGTATSRTAPSAGCRPRACSPRASATACGRRAGRSARRAPRVRRAVDRTTPSSRDLVEVRQRDVLDDRAQHQEPLPLAILGQHHDAAADRLPRRARAAAARPSTSTAPRRAIGRRRRSRARPRSGRCRSARRARRSRRRGSRTRRPSTAGGRARPRTESTTGASAGGGCLLGEREAERPAEHRGDEALRRLARGGRRLHELPVAQHGDRVGEREHLGEEVRDVDDRRAAVAAAAGRARRAARASSRGQRRGRLVHDRRAARRARSPAGSRPSAGRRRAACARASGRAARCPSRSTSCVEAPRELRAARRRPRPVLDAEEDVLEHRPVRDERRLLRDHRDPVRERVARRAVVDAAPVDPELAVVGPVDAGDDLAERRLAGAVLADERVDRAAARSRGRCPTSACTPPKRFETPRSSAYERPSQRARAGRREPRMRDARAGPPGRRR